MSDDDKAAIARIVLNQNIALLEARIRAMEEYFESAAFPHLTKELPIARRQLELYRCNLTRP